MSRRDRSFHCLAVAGAVALVAAALPAAAASRAQELGRTNVFTARGAAFTEVEIPRDVTISNPLLAERHFSIESDAKFAGFALVLEKPGFVAAWIGGRVHAGGRTGYFFVSADPFEGMVEEYTLPAATYRLYVFSSDRDARTRLSLRLPELGGTAGGVLTREAAFQVEFPSVRTEAGAQLHSFDATGTFDSTSGVLFSGTWFATSAQGPTYYEACFYEGRPPTELGGRATGCTAAELASFAGYDVLQSSTGGQTRLRPQATPDPYVNFLPAARSFATGENWLPGRFSVVFTAGTAAMPEDLQAVALWLGL